MSADSSGGIQLQVGREYSSLLSQFRGGNEIIDLIMKRAPVGVIVLNGRAENIYTNRRGSLFLNRFGLPDEILRVCKRMFEAISTCRLHELFPGEVLFTKKLNGSPSNWRFSLAIHEPSPPLIIIFITEETIANKINMNELRKQYLLTRKEVDVLTRVLNGLKNLEISEELEITEQTVKDHLSNIYRKIGVEDRMSLVRSLLYCSPQ